MASMLAACGAAAASAPEEQSALDRRWSHTDTVLQLTFTAVTAYDWAQTRTFLREESWEESNPILGKRPSRAKVNVLIGGAIVGHAAVAWLLPKPFRTQWQVLFIAVEGLAVRNNHLMGVRVQF